LESTRRTDSLLVYPERDCHWQVPFQGLKRVAPSKTPFDFNEYCRPVASAKTTKGPQVLRVVMVPSDDSAIQYLHAWIFSQPSITFQTLSHLTDTTCTHLCLECRQLASRKLERCWRPRRFHLAVTCSFAHFSRCVRVASDSKCKNALITNSSCGTSYWWWRATRAKEPKILRSTRVFLSLFRSEHFL